MLHYFTYVVYWFEYILVVQYSPIPETMPERCQICKEYSEALASELKDVTVRQGLVQEAKHNLCHRVPLIGDSCRQVAQNFMSTVLSKTLSYTEGDRFCEVNVNYIYKVEKYMMN